MSYSNIYLRDDLIIIIVSNIEFPYLAYLEYGPQIDKEPGEILHEKFRTMMPLKQFLFMLPHIKLKTRPIRAYHLPSMTLNLAGFEGFPITIELLNKK
jgi:hypothetical protein